MPSRPTSVSVRVARWAAIAAAITAFGSVFNTMWSERPWWETPKPTPVVASAPVPVGEHRPLMMPETSAEAPTPFSWSKWALIGSAVILVGAGAAEGIHRWRSEK